MTSEAFLHFNHPTWILCVTSPLISPLLYIIDPRYWKLDTFGIICSPIFTSKLLFVCLFLNLYSIYSVLFLLRWKPFDSKASLTKKDQTYSNIKLVFKVHTSSYISHKIFRQSCDYKRHIKHTCNFVKKFNYLSHHKKK